MTRALRFSKAELKRAVELVRDEDVAVKLTRDGGILLIPAKHIAGRVDPTEDDILDAELKAFEEEHGYR
ncbi:MAG: hypothetical protein KF810_17095 [Rhizobiaceae bacterium]|nr:hypothetical protein [Rhizobiaceae bacterium]